MSCTDTVNYMLQHPTGIDKIAALIVNVARLNPLAGKANSELVSMLNEFRCILRLPGLYKLLVNFDRRDSLESHLSTAINVCYYLTEGLAFLGNKQIISMSKSREDQLSLISCRCWLLDTLLTIYQLFKKVRSTHDKQDQWDLAANALSLPLCIHWSIGSGLGLSKQQIGALGLFSTVVQVRKLLRALHEKKQ
ncbi:peroxisomal protein Pex11-like protein [Schizosaccharomyces osmophilus]|uniref:Peroxisomal protein Pex11-like protein n=1 Tax=Schizosaccharomyces osmophilus TaxID=2545709 RepID=A0AAE9WH05_9SCHI|nr:peroxisomal protein Pex11-like protein [Schizosaccharomyces osmophilus]WBW74781.1 peroxisomal protein Pex11-like protein [Schizosaccharomyces osmophilus]